ncbi:MAG TPA: phosphoglucosamine mutase [Rhodothermales bacterium]
MTLIASISGIRGIFGDGLDPAVLVRYATAYGRWCAGRAKGGRPVVVVGRDGRTTGSLCSRIVTATLQATGCDVVDAGLATTPTVEMGVIFHKATGGIVLSASHNPPEWNALKLLNEKGEFLSADEGEEVLKLADQVPAYVRYDAAGSHTRRDFLDAHIDAILALPYVNREVIKSRGFRVVVDAVNSVGGIAVPRLLERLGVDPSNVICLNCEPTGIFAHPAEPLPENLVETCARVAEIGADLGVVVDPDADRLALIDGQGRYVSEELTQVLAADFLWGIRKGPFVTNLSSSRVIEDVAARHGQQVHRSAVGEINVVKKMQAVGAVLGGEGNGGVIVPDLHYGRDALVGITFILQHLAQRNTTLAELHDAMPRYAMMKSKLPLEGLDPDGVLDRLAARYAGERVNREDGLKVDFDNGWVHFRKSNTEPIMRIYAEARTEEEVREMVDRIRADVAAP